MKYLSALCLLLFLITASLAGCDSAPTASTVNPPANIPIPPTKAQLDSAKLAAQEQAVSSLTDRIERMKHSLSNPQGLVQAFEDNEVQATDRFKGKRLLIAGTVEKIGLDILSHPYLILGPASGFRKVQCLFADKSAVSSLNKGQQVTLVGNCNGLMMNVLLEDCAIVEDLATLRAKLKAMPKPHSKPMKKQNQADYFKG